MSRLYTVRYVVIALIISAVFVMLYAALELLERGQPFRLMSFLAAVGPKDWLVFTVPLILTTLAWQAGRQRDAMAALGRQRETLNAIQRAVLHAAEPDLDQVLSRVMQQLAAALQADAAAALLLEHDEWIVSAATPTMPDALLPIVRVQPWPPQPPSPIVHAQVDGSHVWLTAIHVETEPIGWLVVVSRLTSKAQSNFDLLLTAIADLIGSAVSRSRQHAALRRRARDLEAIAQMNRTLLAGMPLDAVLDTIVSSAQVRFGLPFVGILWVDEPASEFYMRAQAGPLAQLMPPHYRQKLTDGIAAQVVQTARPYLVKEVSAEPAFIKVIAAPVQSSFMAPMIAGDKVIAVMEFDSVELQAFSAEDVAALTTLADQAAIAAENARLIFEAQRDQRRVTAILHSTRDAVILIDIEDHIQVLNPAAERLSGVTMAEAAGLPIDLLFNLHPVVEAYRQADQLEPEAPAFEVVLDKMTYLVTLTQARDETGAVFGRVLMLKDITYLKQLDQFKSQMVQLASHDLRTPLGVAIGYLEVLKEELRPVSSFQQQTLTGLETALNRMQTLVTDLLDLERVEAGIDHSRVMIDVNTLAAEAVTEFEETADARRQRLECSLSAGALLVAGDPTRLKQAIGNLISNAVKYTPEGGSIWVRVRPDDRHVLIEVQDTGYGIPAEVQAKLFQRFFRARVPGTEHVPGTGLGLSLTKAVIEQHAGHVTAESKEGQGSTFRIWLPLAAGEDTTS